MDKIICECGSDNFTEINIWTMSSRLDALFPGGDGPEPEYSGDTEWGECALIDSWLCGSCGKEIPGPNAGAWALAVGHGVLVISPAQLREIADDLEREGPDFCRTILVSGVNVDVVAP
jgi:hypothetical protein